MRRSLSPLLSVPLMGLILYGSNLYGAENAASLLIKFSKAWPQKRTPFRTEGDESWKAYALTLRALVALNTKAIPDLIKGCGHPNAQVRALCARTLGFLKAQKATGALIKLLGDKHSPVTLLAADALGQIQDPKGLAALKQARTKQKMGDVLLHISKALDRKVGLESDVQKQILKMTPKNIGSAKVGVKAPEFTLMDSDNKPWALSDFKGKKAVVLVFNYGDG